MEENNLKVNKIMKQMFIFQNVLYNLSFIVVDKASLLEQELMEKRVQVILLHFRTF